MRYSGDHKARTRERVLRGAAKAIREHGPGQVGVASIMADAGLTHGGFYAHFKSKSDFVAEAIDAAFAEGRERFHTVTAGRSDLEALSRYIDFYLSRAHRDAPGLGCPIAALSGEAHRLDPPARAAFAAGVARLHAALVALLPRDGEAQEALAWSLISEMVGALALARALAGSPESDAALKASRTEIKARLGLPNRAWADQSSPS